MNQAARHLGRTLALLLPVVLVLSGTLAVAHVPWAAPPADTQILTASAKRVDPSDTDTRAPEEVLREKLLAEQRRTDPGTALTSLQRAVTERPSLAKHCRALARALGRAAVERFGAARAQSYARPVCDTSFAAGVAQAS